MKIAIHHREGSFSDRWIRFCKKQSIEYIIVDCHSGNIIKELKNNKVSHLMWHVNHASNLDLMTYQYVLNSADKIGIKTFPNFDTRWHFDDKIAQKFLLESIDAPLAPSYVFFTKETALEHIKKINYPIVAKLKRGAGASNVKLIHNKTDAQKYIEKMFTEGITSLTGTYTYDNLEQKFRIAKRVRNPLKLSKKIINYFKKSQKDKKYKTNEKGYFYYQEFLPNNNYDTRIIVIGNKAVGIRRLNRRNDFRASGSGNFSHKADKIDLEMIKIAFDLNYKLSFQSLAFDFVYDINNQPKIIEICFGFSMKAYDACEGFWDSELNFYQEKINLQEEMIKEFIK